jgi:hypothetical protein
MQARATRLVQRRYTFRTMVSNDRTQFFGASRNERTRPDLLHVYTSARVNAQAFQADLRRCTWQGRLDNRFYLLAFCAL